MSAGVDGGNLLDTCTALFALARPGALSAAARKAVLRGPNFLSVATYWEVMLKSMKGSLDVGDPHVWWVDALEQLAASPLALRPRHVAGIFSLPPIHKDPFNRMLIAQAAAEELILVTTDKEIRRYATGSLRVLG